MEIVGNPNQELKMSRKTTSEASKVGRAKEFRFNRIDTRARQHNMCNAKLDSDYDEIEDICVTSFQTVKV